MQFLTLPEFYILAPDFMYTYVLTFCWFRLYVMSSLVAPQKITKSQNHKITKSQNHKCSRAAGQGCYQQVVALLYPATHLQKLELECAAPITSETWTPRGWHITFWTYSIGCCEVSVVSVRRVKKLHKAKKRKRTAERVQLALCNPVHTSTFHLKI